MNKKSAVQKWRLYFIFMVLFLGVSATLLWRWSALQIDQHSHFSKLARENQIKLLPVEPPRGNIFDRNGVQLTENKGQFSLKVDSVFAAELLGKIDTLTTIIRVNNSAIKKMQQAQRSKLYRGEIILREKLEEQEVQDFIQWQFLFPEVVLFANLVRSYPYGDAAGHVVGYVGRINQAEADKLKKQGQYKNYRAAKFIGKTGIEYIYEDTLRGTVGSQEAEVDAHGRIYQRELLTPPITGKDIYLSLDWRLQTLAENLLSGERGAVVLLDIYSGEVLVLASNPRFDGNQFVFGITQENWDKLNTSADKPLIHRAIYGQYAPGSVIKPFLGLSALQNQWRDLDYTYHSKGFFKIDEKHIFHDWKKGGHGKVDIEKSIVRSVNTFYYKLGYDVGIDAIHIALSKFGFGQESNLDLNNEKGGLLPNSEWKQKAHGKPWYLGDTISSSVGQGYVQMTPLQMARAMAMIANNGQLVQPYLYRQSSPSPPRVAAFKPNYLQAIKQALEKVTQPGGTAYSTVGQGAAYGIAGKTGTAQVSKLKYDEEGNRLKNEDLPKKLRDHAWFVGYAPLQGLPRVSIAVIVENGGSGGKVAGPIVRQVLDKYMELYAPNPLEDRYYRAEI